MTVVMVVMMVVMMVVIVVKKVVLRVWRGPMPGWWCVTRHPSGTHVLASAGP